MLLEAGRKTWLAPTFTFMLQFPLQTFTTILRTLGLRRRRLQTLRVVILLVLRTTCSILSVLKLVHMLSTLPWPLDRRIIPVSVAQVPSSVPITASLGWLALLYTMTLLIRVTYLLNVLRSLVTPARVLPVTSSMQGNL